MNYIKRLENDVRVMRQGIEAYDVGIDDIVRYLTSPKFQEDPTVQIQDVLNRIMEARMMVTAALDKLSDRCPYPGLEEG